ncbi:MAG: histidine kinase [Bryobacteraceae bacterium]
MTIAGYDAVYVITLVMVAFGALTFSVLTLHYWREATSRRDPVFAAFTLVCAAAFLINVLIRMEPHWETPLAAALDVATGLVPPLLLQLVSRDHGRRVTRAFYGIGAVVAIALILDDVSPLAVPFRDQAPAILLAAAGALGLFFIDCGDGRLRIWYRVLLSLTVIVAVAGLLAPSPDTAMAPDYLLLAFFCVTLYFRERVIFFDLLIKRGVFFCFAFAALALLLSAAHVPGRLTIILLLTPLWLLAPWADAALARVVDRLFLRRRYSPLEAERRVLRELQLAGTEDDLRGRAGRSLSDVFGCIAEVRFEWPAGQTGDEGMAAVIEGLGQVILRPRVSGIPYMTDDRRLLDSLARSLGVVLENVRFREQQGRQQEREQQLRLLATRAELKALRAQINPHFLFNALNTVAGFLPSQPEMADYAIEQLAQIFRYTLRKSERERVGTPGRGGGVCGCLPSHGTGALR